LAQLALSYTHSYIHSRLPTRNFRIVSWKRASHDPPAYIPLHHFNPHSSCKYVGSPGPVIFPLQLLFSFSLRSATKTSYDASSRTSFPSWTELPTISSLHTACVFPAWRSASHPTFPIGGTSRPGKPSAPGTLSRILPVRRGSRIGAQQDLPAHVCITRLCKETPL
jgi:hypothetical protein